MNIFTSKASHMTKSLTFTMDRIIWLTNHMNELLDYDYVVINRSYLSNLFYRTMEIEDSETFIEYLITVFHNEVKSVNLDNFELIPLFIKTEEQSYLKAINESKKNLLLSTEDVERELQYIQTIHNNFPHLQYLKEISKENTFYKKYEKYFNEKDFYVTNENYNEDFISNKILEIL